MTDYGAFKRAAEFSPTRCTGITKAGQCPYEQVPGSKFCKMHGGNKQSGTEQKQFAHDFQLRKWNARVGEFAQSQNRKTLYGELGILRLTLENIINLVDDESKFMIYADKIAHLAGQIHKIVNDIQKLEEKSNQLMDKQTLMALADSLLAIIADHVEDSDTLVKIGDEFHVAVISVGTRIENT